MSVPEGDPAPYEATPGELLAVVHAMFMAWSLADGLIDGGRPADELVVTADCSFEGPISSRNLVAVDVSVFGRVPGLDARAFEEAANVASRRYRRASGARDDIPGRLEAVLAEPFENP